jgi:amidohydrolase
LIEHDVTDYVKSITQQIITWRRWFHAHPELAWQESDTRAFIEKELNSMGFHAYAVTPTSVIADIGPEHPTIALRADMDGLPIQEETGLPFSSENVGKMHACGHDGHMAMLLGVASYFSRHTPRRGGIRLIFQPAEEVPPGGASELVKSGVMDGIRHVFGLHLVETDPVGVFRLSSGTVLANADSFDVTIIGQGGHGAEPLGTVDANLLAANIIMSLHHVVGRMTSPIDPVALTVGVVNGGTARNIIAEQATLQGTLRTISKETQTRLCKRMDNLITEIARAYGGVAKFQFSPGYPALINERSVVERLSSCLDTPGLVSVNPEWDLSLAGDDFAYYLEKAPGAYGFLGCGPESGIIYSGHSPKFDINERALPLGTMILIQGALELI